MSNAELNKAFLDDVDTAVREAILKSIGTHYGISLESVLEEVTQENAEHLCEYMVGPTRTATWVMMKKFERKA